MNYFNNNVIKPKFIENTNSTRFSTNESNESFESSNKFEDRCKIS